MRTGLAFSAQAAQFPTFPDGCMAIFLVERKPYEETKTKKERKTVRYNAFNLAITGCFVHTCIFKRILVFGFDCYQYTSYSERHFHHVLLAEWRQGRHLCHVVLRLQKEPDAIHKQSFKDACPAREEGNSCVLYVQ